MKITLPEIITYCTVKQGAAHEYKTAWEADVFTVGGKMFGFVGADKSGAAIINLKNEPHENLDLRAEFDDWVTPGYYSNKDHWNSWYWQKPGANWQLLKQQIDCSYELILASLSKKQQQIIRGE